MECAVTEESSNHCLDDDDSSSKVNCQNQFLVETLKHFNKCRRILLTDIPRATYEEIRDFFGEFGVADITIHRKMKTATVLLRNGAEAEDICLKLQNKPLLNERVGVSVRPNYNLLCVAHLPFSMTDASLATFAAQMGIVERCFLMRSEKTGQSKGYGFIEFAHNRDHTNTIRLKIDRKLVGGSVVHCDFVAYKMTSYTSLHSKCLLLNYLPSDATDQTISEMLTKIVPLQYLKTGVSNGKCLGFAIVECRTPDQAERLQIYVHGRPLFPEKHVSATYCIPGIPGKDLFDKLMTMRLKSQPPQPVAQTVGPNIPTPPNNANPMLQSLFQQLQVLQQNFQQMVQAPKPNYYNSSNNRGPMTSPLNNPMIQQAISLLVMSMHQPQMSQQISNFNPRNAQPQNPRLMNPSVASPPAQGNQLLQGMMTQIRNQLTNLQGQQYIQNQQLRYPKPSQPYPRPGQHQRMNGPRHVNAQRMNAPVSQPRHGPPSRPQYNSSSGQTYHNRNYSQQNYSNYWTQNQVQQNLTQTLQPLMNNLQSLLGNLQQPSQNQQGQVIIQTIVNSVTNALTNLMRGQGQTQPVNNGNSTPATVSTPTQKGESGYIVDLTTADSSYTGYPAAEDKTYAAPSEPSYDLVIEEGLEKRDKTPIEAEEEAAVPPADEQSDKTEQSRIKEEIVEEEEGEEEVADKTTDDSFEATLKQIADYGNLIRDCYGESGYNHFKNMTADTKARQASLWAQQGSQTPSLAGWEALSVDGAEAGKSASASGYEVDHEALKRIFNGAKAELTRSTSVQEEKRPSTPDNDREPEAEGEMAAPSASTPASQALKRSASYSLPDPEPSPEGDYVGLHSQGIGGHYADSYIKRKRLL